MVTFYLISLLPFRRLGSLHFRWLTERMRNVPHCRAVQSASESRNALAMCAAFFFAICHLLLPFASRFRLSPLWMASKGDHKVKCGTSELLSKWTLLYGPAGQGGNHSMPSFIALYLLINCLLVPAQTATCHASPNPLPMSPCPLAGTLCSLASWRTSRGTRLPGCAWIRKRYSPYITTSSRRTIASAWPTMITDRWVLWTVSSRFKLWMMFFNSSSGICTSRKWRKQIAAGICVRLIR